MGPIGGRRGESLFAEQIAANPATTDVAVLSQAAEGFYRAGQPDRGAGRIRSRRARSTRGRPGRQGVRAGLRGRGAIEQERKNYEAAAEPLPTRSLWPPRRNPKRPDAHLMGDL